MTKKRVVIWVCTALVLMAISAFVFIKAGKNTDNEDKPNTPKVEEPVKRLEEDFAITEEELNLEEFEDKTLEEKEKLVEKRESETKIETKSTTSSVPIGVNNAYKWVSSFDANAKRYGYSVNGYNVSIGDWRFVLDEKGNIREYLYDKEPDEKTLEALETVYPWGEMEKTNTGYKWVKPSEVCSRNTVGWDYDKNGIAEGCPAP